MSLYVTRYKGLTKVHFTLSFEVYAFYALLFHFQNIITKDQLCRCAYYKLHKSSFYFYPRTSLSKEHWIINIYRYTPQWLENTTHVVSKASLRFARFITDSKNSDINFMKFSWKLTYKILNRNQVRIYHCIVFLALHL